MAFSMHRISAPVFGQMLANLDYIFEQATAFVAEHSLDEAVLMQRRLAPDMFTLGQQVLWLCDFLSRRKSAMAWWDTYVENAFQFHDRAEAHHFSLMRTVDSYTCA